MRIRTRPATDEDFTRNIEQARAALEAATEPRLRAHWSRRIESLQAAREEVSA